MAINLRFDLSGNPEPPTIILANRNGNKLGQLQIDEKSIDLTDKFNDASEFSFILNKYIDGKLTNLWDSVVDFKLVYCKEWDCWFEIKVELDETTKTIKTVFCTQLGQAELSQIYLYNIEINTEEDIERDDYKVSVLYKEDDYKASILHRMLDKAPHYSIIHVDKTIANIQRSFSFDGTSIYDAFQEVAEEIGCLFVFHSNSDENGNIQRTISVFDLQQNCLNEDCGYRGEFTDVCPKCGSRNILNGYGEDTLIFVTSDELASSGIQLTTDTDSVKNCFKLEAGDDLMTATVRNCNPNGSDYIYYFSDSVKEDMADELVNKIEAYDEVYRYYQEEYESDIDNTLLGKYNLLVNKYSTYNEDIQSITKPVTGYPALMNAYYNTIDLNLYLESGLMPSVKMSETSAEAQAALLTSSALSPVAVADVTIVSLATVDSAILGMAKVVVKSTYKVKVNESEIVEGVNTKSWRGNFVLTNYSDEEDTAISNTITVTISDNLEEYVQQKLEKVLNRENTDDLDITGLFKKEYNAFCAELKKYALNPLVSFRDACESCIDILIEQGAGNSSTWSDDDSEANLYENLYKPYRNKLKAIEEEIKIREDEINIISGVYSLDGNLISDGLQTNIEKFKNIIQNALDFEKYLGSELWLEFCSYRREDKYSNSNYISDGLNNAELFKRAQEFIDVAENEIYKSSELQHSISTTLNNLLAISKFKSLVSSFNTGNWIRIQIDEKIYKLRLLEYGINFGDFNNINVEFSDVTKVKNGISDVESILSKASSMATSYGSVQRQVGQNEKTTTVMNDWVNNGLDATSVKIIGGADNQTQTWDNHGMLFREFDSINETYSDEQLKIINSTLAITNDNWETTKTAIGKHYYYDPVTRELKCGYGVNAEVIVGKLILGEELGLYNSSGSMSFDDNGFEVTNGVNSFKVDPNSDVLLSISNQDKNVFFVDKDGQLHIALDGDALDISANTDILDLKAQLLVQSESISMMVRKGDVINEINADTTGVRINGSKVSINADDLNIDASTIRLEGLVTANDNFKILMDGSTEMKNAKLSGHIEADTGFIGSWHIYNQNVTGNYYDGAVGAIYSERYSMDDEEYFSDNYIAWINTPGFDERGNPFNVYSIQKTSEEDPTAFDVIYYVSTNGNLYTEGMIYASSGVSYGGNGVALRSVMYGQVYLNSSSATNVAFGAAMPDGSTPIVVLTPVTTASGACSAKLTSVNNTGFSAIIGNSGWGNTLFNYVAFGLSTLG